MTKLLLNPWVLLGLAVALIASFGWGAHIGSKLEVANQLKDEARLELVADAAQHAAAQAISKLKVVNKTVYQETQREVFNNPVYSECKLPADGLRLLTDAIQGRAVPAGGSGVPATGAPGQ